MRVSASGSNPSPYLGTDEVEVTADDPTRPLVTSVDTLWQAPYFAALFRGTFAPVPRNAAGRLDVRLPEFSRSACKSVLNQLRTGVGPKVYEMRSDKYADYLRLADYLGIEPPIEPPRDLVIMEPVSTFSLGALRDPVFVGDSLYYVQGKRLWRCSAGPGSTPKELLVAPPGREIRGVFAHHGRLFAIVQMSHDGYFAIAHNDRPRLLPRDYYTFDLAQPTASPLHAHEDLPANEYPWSDKIFVARGDEVFLGDLWSVYAFDPSFGVRYVDSSGIFQGDARKRGQALVTREDRVRAMSTEFEAFEYNPRSFKGNNRPCVRLLDRRSRVTLTEIFHQDHAPRALLLHNDDLYIAWPDGTVRQYDAATGTRRSIVKDESTMEALGWHDDKVVTVDSSGTVKAWRFP